MNKFDKKKSIQEKNKIQELAVEGSRMFQHILLSWSTGCGKTLGALKIVKDFYQNDKNIRGYLICKESNHLENWEEDIDLHGMNFINGCTDKFLYASSHKYSEPVDFIILDEAHNITESKLDSLRLMMKPTTRIIMLTATLPDNKKWLIKSLTGKYNEFHISIDDAIQRGILPHPKVFVHRYKLDDKVKNVNLTFKPKFKKYTYTNLTEKAAYNIISDVIDDSSETFEKDTSKMWAYNKVVNLGSVRKKLMANLKTNRAKQLISREMDGKRHIIFTGSKEQAECLGSNFIHSGRHKKKNNELRIKFNNLEIDNLILIKMFREGMNLVNIEKGLVIQLDSVKLNFLQILGRVFRSDIPEMHLMIFKDTQDEKYLENVLEGFNMNYVEFINYY